MSAGLACCTLALSVTISYWNTLHKNSLSLYFVIAGAAYAIALLGNGKFISGVL